MWHFCKFLVMLEQAGLMEPSVWPAPLEVQHGACDVSLQV
jgi:hypothetical protein